MARVMQGVYIYARCIMDMLSWLGYPVKIGQMKRLQVALEIFRALFSAEIIRT